MNTTGHSKLMFSLKMTMLSLFGASVLAGCGIRGSLKTPPPVFSGDKAEETAAAEAEETAEEIEEEDIDLLNIDPENE